jgi:hypothetical protein|tara:strand:+ start:787 stop:990 length:204 start_codon:yes stop_codon:yes gene_type:complete
MEFWLWTKTLFQGDCLFGSIHLPVAQNGGPLPWSGQTRCVQTPSITGKLYALIHGQFKGLENREEEN